MALLVALTLWATAVDAQQDCSATLVYNERINCEKQSADTGDISIDLDSGVAISTTGKGEDGIKATHAGTADITIDVTGTSTDKTISTAGSDARGIYGKHTGTGNVDIDVTGVSISTGNAGGFNDGVFAEHTGTGNIDINIQGRTTGGTTTPTTITTQSGAGVHAWSFQAKGSVRVTVSDATLNTAGTGVDAKQANTLTNTQDALYANDYNLTADIRDSKITTTGDQSIAVSTLKQGWRDNRTPPTQPSKPPFVLRDPILSLGKHQVTVARTEIETTGQFALGIFAKSEVVVDDTVVKVTDSTITAKGSHVEGIRIDHGTYGASVAGESGGVILVCVQ